MFSAFPTKNILIFVSPIFLFYSISRFFLILQYYIITFFLDCQLLFQKKLTVFRDFFIIENEAKIEILRDTKILLKQSIVIKRRIDMNLELLKQTKKDRQG